MPGTLAPEASKQIYYQSCMSSSGSYQQLSSFSSPRLSLGLYSLDREAKVIADKEVKGRLKTTLNPKELSLKAHAARR